MDHLRKSKGKEISYLASTLKKETEDPIWTSEKSQQIQF